jgi:hypothetical protein
VTYSIFEYVYQRVKAAISETIQTIRLLGLLRTLRRLFHIVVKGVGIRDDYSIAWTMISKHAIAAHTIAISWFSAMRSEKRSAVMRHHTMISILCLILALIVESVTSHR